MIDGLAVDVWSLHASNGTVLLLRVVPRGWDPPQRVPGHGRLVKWVCRPGVINRQGRIVH